MRRKDVKNCAYELVRKNFDKVLPVYRYLMGVQASQCNTMDVDQWLGEQAKRAEVGLSQAVLLIRIETKKIPVRTCANRVVREVMQGKGDL